MSDLISRQKAIQRIKELPNSPNGYSATYDKASIIMAIEDVEPVEPVTHAHWKRKFKREGVYEDLWLYCSNCNSRTAEEYAPYWWTYCPYCGAIMDEKEGKE